MTNTRNVSPNFHMTRSRGPKGAAAKRTVVALLPHEREELERLADLDSRTYSALGRIYLMRGMRADPNYCEAAKTQEAGQP